MPVGSVHANLGPRSHLDCISDCISAASRRAGRVGAREARPEIDEHGAAQTADVRADEGDGGRGGAACGVGGERLDIAEIVCDYRRDRMS